MQDSLAERPSALVIAPHNSLGYSDIWMTISLSTDREVFPFNNVPVTANCRASALQCMSNKTAAVITGRHIQTPTHECADSY